MSIEYLGLSSINSASYGIDGTVDFIYRMITAREEDK